MPFFNPPFNQLLDHPLHEFCQDVILALGDFIHPNLVKTLFCKDAVAASNIKRLDGVPLEQSSALYPGLPFPENQKLTVFLSDPSLP
ncbi:hypothetical protein D3C74_444620 [compost metagenome]